jgi:hypothetical protein
MKNWKVLHKMSKKTIHFLFLLLSICGVIFSQEALKSHEEEYYDFLALRGLAERPYLNYRTLSDSVWAVSDEAHPWQDQNLGKKRRLFGDVFMRIYGPELFMSANTAAPYGQNDGALWQGKGFNAAFTGGLRLEGYGLELTFKPQLAFSQNLDFEIMKSNYDSEYGYFWGYGHNTGIDAPQRFGDKPFFTWDWGDSEVRYSWKTLTIGFGTQAVWLGPARLNSILHSNNAPSYPKFDMGIRKQPVTIPWINWYLGDVEFRIWTGYLSESDYFDTDPENDHTMFHGLSFAYAPSFLPGLTLSANRVCLVAWEWENLKYIFPSQDNTKEDQKASFGFSYIFPQVGFEVYGELGVDDFVPGGFSGYLRYPLHTLVYMLGLKKTVGISPAKNIYGEFIVELGSMEMSQDFQFQWPYSFYFHHNAKKGYTNKGQIIGAGSGGGGNSQYLELRIYYPNGSSSLFLHRNNPDNNFIYSKAIPAAADSDLEIRYFTSWRSNVILGINTSYFLTDSLIIGGGAAYNLIINPQYFDKENRPQDDYIHNFSFQLAIKYQF